MRRQANTHFRTYSCWSPSVRPSRRPVGCHYLLPAAADERAAPNSTSAGPSAIPPLLILA